MVTTIRRKGLLIMENNNYNGNNSENNSYNGNNGYNENNSGNNNYNENNSYNESGNHNSGSASENTQNASVPQDSSYGYSYIGNQNPNNIWRAQEQTSNGDAQSTESGSSYSHIYGDGNAQYRTASDAKKRKQEEHAKKRAQKAAGANSGFAVKLAKCASIALVFGLVAGTAFEGASYAAGNLFGTNTEKTEAPAKEEEQTRELPDSGSEKRNELSTVSYSSSAGVDVKAIAKATMPSIVAITNLSEVQYRNFFGQAQSYEVPSKGSGIIIAEDDDYLFIATNNHVVEKANTLTIQFCDDTTVAAQVKGTDKSTDLAVVQVKKSDVEKDTLSKIDFATFADSDKCEVGAYAIAIGNALGYGQSVTAGVISAVEREVTLQDESSGETFTNDLIQTDAAINPGNSGGALLNDKGEVIGINSSKYSDTDVEGMGFAIPANTAKPIIEDLIYREKAGANEAAYFGIISGADVNATISQMYGMPEGVFVTEVTEDSPAEKCGIKKGDIITEFDGKAIKSMQTLKRRLAYYKAGDKVDVTVQRSVDGGYEEQKLEIELGSKNS